MDIAELKDPVQNFFRGWLEDWEKPLIRKNRPVVEACFLEKYKELDMYDPDLEITFTVHNGNLEFHGCRGLG